ncbi:pentapeptide repeat-containing protein [Neobacillus sp. DY30]|uniref:pentapeptide repeat-containing protein n=1 Tax=Neobacillus sp. DY30 TaxID=3047871 RepID=UPI0024BF10D1|nr:pentapeptide repeat-containing protein [Neobacillus sp. DY30]WHX98644.1 pentapeptide repeat-containing protein [Neobacillus sp. DY30]
MSSALVIDNNTLNNLRADCENCFGLCCVALPYTKSADFAFNKDGGTPCRNLQFNYLCGIHNDLRNKGFRGCSAYECFGAGQKVSQITYNGKDWRSNQEVAKEMFDVYPIMQQLHEMLWYLYEALTTEAAQSIYKELYYAFVETEELAAKSPELILSIDVNEHRAKVNKLLIRTSELVRAQVAKKQKEQRRGMDYIGAKLKGADLRGANLRGALLIAADLRNADLRWSDFIGADFRDTDISGANLTGSIFLTQAQVNAAKGNNRTKLPASLVRPAHWSHEE